MSKVVFNRTSNGNFCKTIYQPGQFSWTETPKTVPKSLKKGLTEEVLFVYYGLMPVPFPEATSFHAHYVNPDWARKLVFLGRHGNHLFYRNHYGKLED